MSNAALGQKPPVKWMQLFLNDPLVLVSVARRPYSVVRRPHTVVRRLRNAVYGIRMTEYGRR